MLLACSVYTKPILLLNKLRIFWENKNSIDLNFDFDQSNLPSEYATIRRRKKSSFRKSSKRSLSTDSIKSRRGSIMVEFDNILELIYKLNLQLDIDNDSEKDKEESFRDSGIDTTYSEMSMSSAGSFSTDSTWEINERFSTTSDYQESEIDDIFTPKNSTTSSIRSQKSTLNSENLTFRTGKSDIQMHISELIQKWVATSPSTFHDEIIRKSLFSFMRVLSENNCISKVFVKEIINQLNNRHVNLQQFRQQIYKQNKHFVAVNLR